MKQLNNIKMFNLTPNGYESVGQFSTVIYDVNSFNECLALKSTDQNILGTWHDANSTPPISINLNLEDISHTIECHVKDDGIYADVTILDTPSGNALQYMIEFYHSKKADIKIYVVPRCMGMCERFNENKTYCKVDNIISIDLSIITVNYFAKFHKGDVCFYNFERGIIADVITEKSDTSDINDVKISYDVVFFGDHKITRRLAESEIYTAEEALNKMKAITTEPTYSHVSYMKKGINIEGRLIAVSGNRGLVVSMNNEDERDWVLLDDINILP